MIKSRQLFLLVATVILILTVGLLYWSNTDKIVLDPVGGKERPYYFRVELSQWSMKVIDLNRIEDMALEGSSISEAFKISTYTDYLGKLERGSQVYLQIYSLDVQHGISINELDITITILESTEDIASTIPLFYDFFLPDDDNTVTAFCQVFCGLGHSNMKIRFDIGEGKPNYGKQVFQTVIILNAFLALLFSYLITSPSKRKVFLTPSNSNSNNKPNSKLTKFVLYDITKLTEKELVALRFEKLDLNKQGVVVKIINAKTIEDAKLKILENENSKDWNLIEF